MMMNYIYIAHFFIWICSNALYIKYYGITYFILHGEKLIRLSRVVKTGLNNVVLHPVNSIVNNVVEPSMLLQLVNNVVHGVQHNIVQSCFNNSRQPDQFFPV